MKKRVTYVVLALILSFVTGVIVGGTSRRPTLANSNPALALDPAYRDGLYQANLDAREGRRPHLAVGRWSNQSARASYIAGYQEGYRQLIGSRSGSLNESSVAQLAASGFRDGMIDGAWHRLAAQPFQADQTPHFRAAGATELESSADAEVIKNFYREAYLHGYKQAYYSTAK